MNFVETCRKGAGWPSLHRDVPMKPDGKKVWSISQEEVAKFVGQVRSRADDLKADLDAKNERIAKLADEKAAMAKELSEMKAKLLAYEVKAKVGRVGESLDLPPASLRQLEEAVA